MKNKFRKYFLIFTIFLFLMGNYIKFSTADDIISFNVNLDRNLMSTEDRVEVSWIVPFHDYYRSLESKMYLKLVENNKWVRIFDNLEIHGSGEKKYLIDMPIEGKFLFKVAIYSSEFYDAGIEDSYETDEEFLGSAISEELEVKAPDELNYDFKRPYGIDLKYGSIIEGSVSDLEEIDDDELRIKASDDFFCFENILDYKFYFDSQRSSYIIKSIDMQFFLDNMRGDDEINIYFICENDETVDLGTFQEGDHFISDANHDFPDYKIKYIRFKASKILNKFYLNMDQFLIEYQIE